MKLVIKLFLGITILALSFSLAATESVAELVAKDTIEDVITIGNEQIKLSGIDGFSSVDTDHSFYKVMLGFTPDTNQLMNIKISNEDEERLAKGLDASYHRYIAIQTFRATRHMKMKVSQFAQVRGALKDQNETLFAEIEKKYKKNLDKGTKKLNETFDTKLAIEVSDNVPLGVFYNQPERFSSASLTRYKVGDENSEEEFVMAMGLNVLNVKGKIIYLYIYSTYADDADVEWVKALSNNYSSALLSLNSAE